MERRGYAGDDAVFSLRLVPAGSPAERRAVLLPFDTRPAELPLKLQFAVGVGGWRERHVVAVLKC